MVPSIAVQVLENKTKQQYCQDHVSQFVPIDALHVGIAVQVLENKAPQRKGSWNIGGRSTRSPKTKISILAAEGFKKSEFATPPSMASIKK